MASVHVNKVHVNKASANEVSIIVRWALIYGTSRISDDMKFSNKPSDTSLLSLSV